MDASTEVAMTTTLDALLSLRDLSRHEALEELRIGPDQVEGNRSYEGLAAVSCAHNRAASPAHVYFDGDRVALVYLGTRDASLAFTAGGLRERLGGAGEVLRSRQCKRCTLHVYPEAGVAFSAEEDAVGFVEVFPPMSFEEYHRSIYREPPAFIR